MSKIFETIFSKKDKEIDLVITASSATIKTGPDGNVVVVLTNTKKVEVSRLMDMLDSCPSAYEMIDYLKIKYKG